MINIQKSWTREVSHISPIPYLNVQRWLEYVKANWDTSEEPFVMDHQMRCSFSEQLRKQREKEKQERIKVGILWPCNL